jgi:hypothetical protein
MVFDMNKTRMYATMGSVSYVSPVCARSPSIHFYKYSLEQLNHR